jgi:hypothetical protein
MKTKIIPFFVLLSLFIIAHVTTAAPNLYIKSVNSQQVGLYEKFEILIGLENAGYTNPYDPAQIDVRAVFTAPSGKTWEIYAFYDNYLNRNQWKARFAPNETGIWNFYLKATAATGTAQTASASFTAITSSYPGWIHVSSINPHYLIHDNGSGYYGVGVYSPWGNSVERLDDMESYDANMFGIWNIMYGGLVGDAGIIEEELGRYNQEKCGRIDSLIYLSEQRNLLIMFAIWPHDLFSNTVWAHQWHQNPYRFICDVVDVFSDETCWEYQEKQYRYLIARFGYSRAWGIWEIINEANGTDAWVAGRGDDAAVWVGKVHQYFQENDPYDHPTTASMSGGQYWPAGYANADMPNVHVYETGWAMHYPGNAMRSSMWIYHDLSRRFWQDFTKPALFGEAGYTDSYGGYQPGTDDYTAAYHNSLWSSWASGISITPVWWSFEILQEEDFEQMQAFSRTVNRFSYATEKTEPLESSGISCDVFCMGTNQKIFGWLREINGLTVTGRQIFINTATDTSWHFYWYDTWTGSLVAETYEASLDGSMAGQVPQLSSTAPDMAFFAEYAEPGTVPAQLELRSSSNALLTISPDSISITCLVRDAVGRLCVNTNSEITFEKTGPGQLLGTATVATQNGRVEVHFKADSLVGVARIIASSSGMVPDTLYISVSNRLVIDDFETYTTNEKLLSAWIIRGGSTGELTLEKNIKSEGKQALRYWYKIGDGSPAFAGVIKKLGAGFDQAQRLSFWFKGDGSGRILSIRIKETTNRSGIYEIPINSKEPRTFDIPLTVFVMDDGGVLNVKKLRDMWISILPGETTDGEGTLYFDDIIFKVPGYDPTVVTTDADIPETFRLLQNYPNPFNRGTVIQYALADEGPVTLSIYSITGQRMTELVNQVQAPGEYSVAWQSDRAASGIYFYVLHAGEHRFTRRCVLIK